MLPAAPTTYTYESNVLTNDREVSSKPCTLNRFSQVVLCSKPCSATAVDIALEVAVCILISYFLRYDAADSN